MTTDIRVVQQNNSYWDFEIDENGDLSNGDFFDSSLVYSLLGEQRATPSELPTSELRRGWLGNQNSTYENGSKLWLFEQARITRTTLSAIQSAALDCLQWLVDDGYLVNIEVKAKMKSDSIALELTLFRFNSKVERRFFELWDNTGAM